VTLSKISRISMISENCWISKNCDSENSRFQIAKIKFWKLTKYQKNITDEEVALTKIPRIFQELLNFQESKIFNREKLPSIRRT